MKMYIHEDGYEIAYLFNKKRLIKVLNSWDISDWKTFLKEEYTSDDTAEMIQEFDSHNWKYKRIACH